MTEGKEGLIVRLNPFRGDFLDTDTIAAFSFGSVELGVGLIDQMVNRDVLETTPIARRAHRFTSASETGRDMQGVGFVLDVEL